MSSRAQWKMIHTLNTCTKGQLSTNELMDMGVDCYNDTIQELWPLRVLSWLTRQQEI